MTEKDAGKFSCQVNNGIGEAISNTTFLLVRRKYFYPACPLLKWEKRTRESYFAAWSTIVFKVSNKTNQRNLKIWADVADKICFGRT